MKTTLSRIAICGGTAAALLAFVAPKSDAEADDLRPAAPTEQFHASFQTASLSWQSLLGSVRW